MHDLPHLASRVFGTPLLIAGPKLDAILGVLGPRLAGQPLEPLDLGLMSTSAFEVTADGIAVIPVTGTLVARSGYLAAASGLMSYPDIGEAIETAAGDPLIKGIVLDVDSPGGEVGGLFDLVDRIAGVRVSFGKPLWAVAGEAALSAAYAIASATDRLSSRHGRLPRRASHRTGHADHASGSLDRFIRSPGRAGLIPVEPGS